MAALLLVVAWHMADLPQIIQLIRRSGRNEITVLLVCLVLTVLFDMVIAISVGVLLASLLFIRTIAEMTKSISIAVPDDLDDVLIYRISGPLFFAAADNLFADLHDKTVHTDHEIKHIVLQCDDGIGYRGNSRAYTFCAAYASTSTTLYVQYAIPTAAYHREIK